MNRSLLATFVLLIAVLTGACGHLQGGSAPDTVSGLYQGDWYGPNPDRSLGELDCSIARKDAETWDATFSATFGGFGEYDVSLEGKRVDDKVVFEGSIDLGETSGGVFDWTGEIVGDQFNGSYTSKFINGTFRMVKAAAETSAK
jgi:hypothetical protein